MRSIMQICFQRSTGLHYLLQHHAKLQQVERLFAPCLSASLQEHVRVANVRQNTLYLHVDNSAWASRVRFLIPQLLACCRQHQTLNGIRRIQIKVQAFSNIPKVPPSKPRLSANNAELLHVHAQLSQYEPLKKALLKLAQNASKKLD